MKKILIFIYSVLCTISGFAQVVTPENATRIACQYIDNSAVFSSSQKDDLDKRTISVKTTTTKSITISGEVPLYVVQLEDGWVLVASDSVATPILAASPVGVFPTIEDMPDAMKWLLSYYERSIKYAQDSIENRIIDSEWYSISGNTSTEVVDTIETKQRSTLPDSCELSRLSLVLWDQNDNNDGNSYDCSKVYNKFCPDWYTPKCGRTYVGCTAVAMGMVMWYYQWPTYAYIPNQIDSLGNISTNTHLVLYNWDNILPELHNTTPDYNVNAIAGFLRDCGYASKMMYKSTGSYASFENAKNALNDVFHFKGLKHRRRDYFIGNWSNAIKKEITEGRPVMYGGLKDGGGGHAMVIYGYVGNLFRINWGWGGMSNSGLYSLDPLKPSNPNGPYPNNQEAIWGLEPDVDCEGETFSGTQSSDILFEVHGGEITLSNYTISSNQEGYYYSNDRIHLTAGFHAQAGSKVHVAVRNVPCYDVETTSLQRIAPNSQDDAALTDELATNNALENIESDMIQSTAIYTISGQLLQTIEGGQRNAAHLPNGMYILQHHMSDGSTRSEKIANNK